MSALNFDITKQTGCLSGRIPSIELVDALTYNGLVKAVHKQLAFPVYGFVVAVDAATKSFDMELDGNRISGLLWEDYVLFVANTINPRIPKSEGSAIIINNEIFSVVTFYPFPVWVGDEGLIYYSEDIEALADMYGWSNLI